jgi:predicted RNA-binding protein with PIN domain
MRWIVDAMNVIGARPDGWWRDRHAAMAGLVERLELWVRTEPADVTGVTVVFEQPPSPPIESGAVTIACAAAAARDSADREIVRLVREDPHPEDVRVVTSDRALAAQVSAAGATVYPASRLRALLDEPAVTDDDRP